MWWAGLTGVMTAATNYAHLFFATVQCCLTGGGEEGKKKTKCVPTAVCVQVCLAWPHPFGDDSFLITSGGPWRRYRAALGNFPNV